MELKKSSLELWLVLPDIHDTPGERLSRKAYHPALQCAENVMKEYQPEGILYLGDATDMQSLCHFDFDKRRKMEGRRYKKDIESLKHMLDKHEKISPKSKRIYIMGNHEEWVNRYLDYNPEQEGTVDFIKDVELDKRKYEVVEYNTIKKLGKALFTHGMYTNTHHAKKMIDIYQKTIFYGHTHDLQSHSSTSPLDLKDVREASSLGCLCDLNPGYMKNQPNKWIHAFGMFWLNTNDGTFQMDKKYVIKGKTIVNGKEI